MIALPAPVVQSGGSPIEIAVTGVRNDRGRVHVEICPPATFLKDCPYAGEAPAHAGTTIVTIPNVPPGEYAAQGTQDENGNGKVDRTLFGIPTEGVGFSNDAKIRMAPPHYAEAAFQHQAAPQRITFALRYLLR